MRLTRRWPGIATSDVGAAGATESIWLDANTSLIAYDTAIKAGTPFVMSPDSDFFKYFKSSGTAGGAAPAAGKK